ncbi:MAG TPA: P1 family peptidase [Thermoanaerobaculia bacterium]
MEPLPPPLPAPEPSLDLPGFTLGHGTDTAGKTGVTVILCPEGALAAAEVRGSATGTRQFDSLVLGHHVASKAHAVVLAGGSGYGLSAAEPVVAHLAEQGHGFLVGTGAAGRPQVVPLVPTAILFDLGFGDRAARPAAELSQAALAAAGGGEVAIGSVGAGTGATVGKARGLDHGMKGGFGFARLTVPGGPTVAAAVAVNAFGDVRDPFDPAAAPGPDGLVAGCRTTPDGLAIAGAERTLAALPAGFTHAWEGNTTLAVVMTDAVLTKATALKVCQMAFGGLYRTLAPALSLYDGDLVVTLSSGEVEAHVNQVGVLAEHAVARAILAGVRAADGFGILPAARDLPAPPR